MTSLALQPAPAPTHLRSNSDIASRPFRRSHALIPSLDGIRALSFFLVFFSHAGFGNAIPGGFGVTVFFFLSGYLITTLLRIEHEKSGRINLRNFYVRRALRILPPFYAVLIGSILLKRYGLLDGSITAGGLLCQFLHCGNYYLIAVGSSGIIAGTSVLWSLAVEEHFYLVFPFVYSRLAKRIGAPAQAALLLGLCLCVLLWRCVLAFMLHARPGYTGYAYLATDTRIDSLLFGCIFAIAANPVLDETTSPLRYSRAKWLAPFALLALLATFCYRNDAARDPIRYTIQGLALAPLFVVAIRGKHTLLFRFLNNRALSALGVLSYGMYLVHAGMIEGLERTHLGSGPIRGALALGLTIAVGIALRTFIELPCNRLRQGLSN